MIVTLLTPGAAAGSTDTFRTTCVGESQVTELTCTPEPTPSPPTLAPMCDGYPGPGSKKPAPPVSSPVTTTLKAMAPRPIEDGLHCAGAAGGGARTCTTASPQLPSVSAHS